MAKKLSSKKAKSVAKKTTAVLKKTAKTKPKPDNKASILKKTGKKIESRKVSAEILDEGEQESPIQAFIEPSADIDLTASLPVEIPAITSSRGITSSRDPVTMYLAEIRKYPLLSREQELEVAQKYYDTKDPKLAQVLVTSNLRFVVKIAAEYSRFGARMIDLIQEGNMGLMHAVKDFNPYKGNKLITYAVWWIRGYIQEYLMKQYSLVKIGTTQNQKKLFYQLQRQKEGLEQLAESPEQLQLLSSQMGIPEDEIKSMAQRMSGKDVSLNQSVDDSSTTSLLDFQKTQDRPPDEELALREQLGNLKKSIDSLRPKLTEKEKIILEERLLSDEPLTLQEIGEKYSITREAVRQTEARLMKKIKEHMGVALPADE